MTAFSQPERRGLERLQIEKPDAHPDADLLTAFAEHSLTPREQEQVLGHLAVCAPCREVVAVAGYPLVEPVPEPVRKRAIWEMPLFHWGAVAATLAVVVVAVSLGTRQAHKSPTAAILNETPPPAARVDADKIVSEPPAKLDKELADNKPASPPTARRAVHLQEQVRYEKLSEQENKGSASGSAVGGPFLPGKVNPNAAPAQAAPPQPVTGGVVARDQLAASANEAVIVDSSKDQHLDYKKLPPSAPKVAQQNEPSANSAYAYKNDETLSVTPQDGVSQMNSAAVPQTAEVQRQKSMLAKTKEEEAGARTMPPAAFQQVHPIESPVTGTEWQITKLGQLQRSFNRGGLWENMLSDHSFLSVAVVRDHIWAGGEKGLLYFSADNGRTWKPVSVRTGSVTLTGNIIRMRFDDDTHGTITTSTGETWTTSDGGQSWQKR